MGYEGRFLNANDITPLGVISSLVVNQVRRYLDIDFPGCILICKTGLTDF